MTDSPNPKTLMSKVARAGLWSLRGWEFEGPLPSVNKSVMLAGPHTSNVDGLLLVLLTKSVGLRANWMVKDSWAKPPMGWVTNSVGAVPIDRTKANGMVGQMIEEFARREVFHLMIPPEGTRAYAEYWKSGFYQIALGAKVPVIPAYVDYSRKRGGLGEAIDLTGNRKHDMDKLRAYYTDGAQMARYPDKYGPVRLKDEES